MLSATSLALCLPATMITVDQPSNTRQVLTFVRDDMVSLHNNRIVTETLGLVSYPMALVEEHSH